MRAGPLSQHEILELLNREFVSSWLLLSNIERPSRSSTTDAGRRLAKLALQEFDYPVETMVISPDGRILQQLQYNDLLDVDPDERTRRYLECLIRAIESEGTP